MNIIKDYINNKMFGGDIKRLIERNKIPNPVVSLKRLNNLGFKPNLIFDIGAYKGSFAETCLSIWPNCRLVLFEALKDKIPFLVSKFSGKNAHIVEGIIGDSNMEKVLYFSDETASSVLESKEIYTKKQVITQNMITLDSYIQSTGISAPNFLKIDTQGFEYQILKGAEKNIPSIEVFLLELNFLEVYYNVRLAHDVIAYLDTFGFVMYDICEIHRRPLDQALFQIDFLFVHKNSFLRKNKDWDIKPSY